MLTYVLVAIVDRKIRSCKRVGLNRYWYAAFHIWSHKERVKKSNMYKTTRFFSTFHIFSRCVKMAQHKSCMGSEVKHFELMVIEIFSIWKRGALSIFHFRWKYEFNKDRDFITNNFKFVTEGFRYKSILIQYYSESYNIVHIVDYQNDFYPTDPIRLSQ